MRGRYQFIHVPKPKSCCSECSRHFEAKEIIHSEIGEDDGKSVVRYDLCPSCYANKKQDVECPDTVLQIAESKDRWQLTKKEEKVSRKMSWRDIDEKALFLLREALATDTNAAHDEAALLALHLVRRKKLRKEPSDTTQSNNDEQQLRVVDTGELLRVPKKISLPSAELEELLQKKLFSQ